MTRRIANAPVTWGVWGPHSLPAHRRPADILKTLQQSGYAGVETGPLRFFADSDEALAETLNQYELECAGAYVPLRPLHGVEVMAGDLEYLREVCKAFGHFKNPGPVILAEETEDAIKQHVRRGKDETDLDLSPSDWGVLIEGFNEAARIVRDHGLMVSYHPHTGTHIEQPHEVDRLLEDTDLDFTLDTGHAAAGGDDSIDLVDRWASRINHVHVKDLIDAPVEKARRERITFGMAEAAAPLGKGDLDLDGFMNKLQAVGYDGWIVVEQDRRPDGGHDHAAVDQEQKENFDWVFARSEWLSTNPNS
ncbi:inosose dehydratase [Devosia pacifica]|uniref:Inosose dehydratase n=1 Tax=Devosia pacifica TaxID=1335967 RepID=A0A918S954_9HYPH|nr:TIM barrel protein [Devosia pacifica]GHA29924.1 inosose dehydratase [Devosia pacifica]